MANLSVVLSAALTFKQPKELKISREVVDFGFCILQTPQLTSALHFSFPLWLGIVFVALGILMCITILLAAPGLLILIFGLFMLLRRHHVVLSGSDGRTYVIRARSAEFAAEVVDRIRTVMTHVAEKPSYVVNIKAGTIEAGTLLDLSSTSVANSAGAAVVRGGMTGQLSTHLGNGAPSAGEAWPAQSSAAARHAPGADGPALSLPPAQTAAHPAAGHVAISGAPGAVGIAGAMHGRVATHVEIGTDPIARDIEAIIALLERNNVAHREQLAQMLRHVQQHAGNGPAGADQARATWTSFAQYAFNYLSGIEGLMGLADRIQRTLFR